MDGYTKRERKSERCSLGSEMGWEENEDREWSDTKRRGRKAKEKGIMGERKMDVVIKMEGEWEYWWVRMTDRRKNEGKNCTGKGERQVKGHIIPEIVNQWY